MHYKNMGLLIWWLFTGLVVSGPNSLDPGNNEKLNVGTGEILLSSSGDELFLDANANFSDGAASPRSKEPLRDSSESATDEEIGNIKYQEFSSGSSSDFNGKLQSKLN